LQFVTNHEGETAMGLTTARALQARRRGSSARIERMIAKADERSPIGSARRMRIKEAARLARRKVRALAAARESVTAIEVDIGLALLQVVEQGLSRNEAFELVGLSRHHGRRYLDLAAGSQTPCRTGSSTASTSAAVPPAPPDDLGPEGHEPPATSTERKP
jgi:hypothetical protein